MTREQALKHVSELIERAKGLSPLSGRHKIFNGLVCLYELIDKHVPEAAGFDFYIGQANAYFDNINNV